MSDRVLITGGAGFIGQHLCRSLLANGYNVRVLDNFNQQVHGDNANLSKDLLKNIDLVRGDIRNSDTVIRAINGVDVVIHFAAETGTGQSIYEIDRYFSVNVQGTATMLHLLQNHLYGQKVTSIILASSRAIYGEGSYTCSTHGLVYPESRTYENLKSGNFEPLCPECGNTVSIVSTEESAPFNPLSIYALTKQVQEQAVLMFARIRGINGFALRYQNVYGPGQSLKNPYTGILAVFANLARQGKLIDIYEDGLESRDFVFIDDIVEATLRAVNFSGKYVGALNVGLGEAVCVARAADEINNYFGGRSEIKTTGFFRLGDIRHNKASITKLKTVLDFTPSITFQKGLHSFLVWVENQPIEDSDAYQQSFEELREHGIVGKGSKS
jgi:dTDP-L-rhamnose 4-epimerase